MPIDLTNPAAAQSRGKSVLALLGSFWTSMYSDNGLVAEYARARNQAELQTFRDLMELVACACRFDVPIYHRSNWSVITFKRSDRKEGTLLTYGTTGVVYGNTAGSGAVYEYGVAPDGSCAYTAPDKLKDVSVIVNRISEPSVTLTKLIDFNIDTDNQVVIFKEDPFDNPLNLTIPIYDETGTHIDDEMQLWLFMADYDWELIYEQFGYALNVYLESSENYKKLINVLWDSLVQSSTFEQLETLLAILTDAPLVIDNEETVEAIYEETYRKLVVTDKHVYICSLTASVTAAVGQTLKAGDRLVDAFTVYRPYRDSLPSATIPSLSIGSGILIGPFQSELVFNNEATPLVVTTDQTGRTRVEWELGGLASDVKLFWDTVHAEGIKSGAISLAQLMDSRYPPAQTPDPKAINLPIMVNPLDFLAKNILRNNASVIVFNTESFGPNALGINSSKIFRQVVPAHNMIFILIQLTVSDEIEMDGIGDTVSAGYDETVTGGTFSAPDLLSESSPHSFVGTETFIFS